MKASLFLLLLCSLIVPLEVLSQPGTKNRARVDSLQKLKDVIGKYNVVSPHMVGNVGGPSPYWHSFVLLTYLSSPTELLNMTYDRSPAVRLYGYIGLVHKKYADTTVVKNRLLLDTAIVLSFLSCVIDEITVAQGAEDICIWYDEERTAKAVTFIQTNNRYRSQLYRALVSGKPIKRRQEIFAN